MFSEKEILERLKRGESSKTIADEMAKALNRAETSYKKEKTEQEKALQTKRKQEEFLGNITKAFKDYCMTYYPDQKDILKKLFNEIDNNADAVDFIDFIIKYITTLSSLSKNISDVFDKDDKIISDFLNSKYW